MRPCPGLLYHQAIFYLSHMPKIHFLIWYHRLNDGVHTASIRAQETNFTSLLPIAFSVGALGENCCPCSVTCIAPEIVPYHFGACINGCSEFQCFHDYL